MIRDFSTYRDFHAVVSITLGELVESGVVDWSDPLWHFQAYDETTRLRLCEKIEGRYWGREISMTPPGVWRRRFISKMNELAPKYNIIYDKIETGANFFQTSDNYNKSRTVYSDFPQTALADNQDYASNGTDNEGESVTEGDTLAKFTELKDYQDVDVMLLDEIEVMFSSLITVNVNGY